MKLSLLLLLCAGLATSARALTLSLPGLPARVRSHHPGLKAARLAVEEARSRRLAAGRLANPSLGFDGRTESRLSPWTGQFSLDQAFPVTRRLSLEKQLTSQLVAAAELEVRDAERLLIAEAQALGVRLLTLEQQRGLRRQQQELARGLADFAQGRALAGELSPLDAKQIQLDAQRLSVEARLLEAQGVAALGQLKPLLGLRAEEPLHLTGELPPLEMPSRSPWQARPDYQLAQARTAAAQTDQALARARTWQDVSVGLVGGPEQQTTPGDGRQRTGFLGLRISIPLPLWNRNQGEIAEKAAAAERARLEGEALALRINGEAGTAWREMETNAAIVRETRDELLPLAREQMDAMQKAYETGQTELQAVLRARDQRLELESSSLDALRDFHLARIRHEAAVARHSPAAPPAKKP